MWSCSGSGGARGGGGHVRPQPGQVDDELVSRGVECVVRHRVERVRMKSAVVVLWVSWVRRPGASSTADMSRPRHRPR